MLTYGSELQKATAVQSFWNQYFEIMDVFDGLVYTRTSTQKTDTYTRLGAAPMPEEWVGDRNAKSVPEYSFDIVNKPWDATVPVDKELIKYQQWDEVGGLVGNLGYKAGMHKVSKLTALLAGGNAAVCDDGQFFFDTDHADPGAAYTTAQDNDLTAAATPTDLQMATAIRACFDAVYGFKDDQGDPIAVNDTPANWVVMVPPSMRAIAMQVLTSSALTGPVGNDLQGTFTVRTNQFMTTAKEFFFFYAGSVHKPLILQESGGLELTDDIDPKNGNYNYSATWWGETGYGQWRTAVMYLMT